MLREARPVPSPNFDSRPAGVAADLIVVHGISLPPGEFGGPWIDRLFTNSLPPDATVTQYVSFNDRAWHAGVSEYEGRQACNDFSIGIELEGTDTVAYDERQYHSLAQAVAALCRAYPSLRPTRLAGHSDIAPGRKTDPGVAFDWPLAHRSIAAACAADRT